MFTGSKSIAVAATMVLGALAAQPATAGSAAPFLPRGMVADAPSGFIEMCQRDLALCAAGAPRLDMEELRVATLHMARPTGRADGLTTATTVTYGGARPSGQMTEEGMAPATTSLDDAMLSRLIRKVNSSVNAHVVQVSDLYSAGVAERWQRPTTGRYMMGDCEDIAIEKRVQLLAAGVPADRLFFAVVYRAGFGLHTILIARLQDGDHVLDSATSRILKWSDVNYVWLRQQSVDDPLRWSSIGDGSNRG